MSSSSSIPTDPWRELSPFPDTRGSESSQGWEHPAFQGLMPSAEPLIPPSWHFPSLWKGISTPRPLTPLPTSPGFSRGRSRSSVFPNPDQINLA